MENDPDRQRIERYLAGAEDVAREVEGWIRREIEISYPILRPEVEDLCQRVHGKLLESLRAGSFQQRSTLKTYVCRITHHAAIDSIRKKYRERTVSVEFLVDTASTGDNPYTSLAAQEDGVLMDQVLLRSPAPCRELWRMVVVERLSYAEIGRRLSIPPGTVKSRMWYCRRKARALLERLQRARRRPTVR